MPRALWKGHLSIAEFSCPVALYAAASTRDRVAFRTVNRRTGNPVRREFVDATSEDPVGSDDQVKGYETGKDQYVILTPEEVAGAVPASDKTLRVEAFIDCPNIDTTYFDKPYYLTPADPAAASAFALVREGLRETGVAAMARAVLFRRVRSLLVRAQGPGLVANTLNFDYEVRSAERAFAAIPERKIEAEMLDLAKHIIKTKRGAFDPAAYTDRYEAALRDLVAAKAEGRAIERPAPTKEASVVSLLDALRQSAGAQGGPRNDKTRGGTDRKSGGRKAAAAPQRKAG